MIDNLNLPLQVISGVICDSKGNPIIKANRDGSTTPLRPTERDQLLHMVVDSFNEKYAGRTNEGHKKAINESIQILDKVAYKKQRGYVIGQTSDGDYIVQVQGNSYFAKPSEVKVLGAKAKTMEPPFKFDEITQKLLLEQYVRCGIYMGSVPIKTSNCYVKYSEWKSAAINEDINVMADGHPSIMPKERVQVFEDPNEFANPDDYVEGVLIDEESEEAIENVLINAIDYTGSIGDSDGVRIIRGRHTEEARLETAPKALLRTLSV